MTTCPKCHSHALRRESRRLLERVRGHIAVFVCDGCGARHGLRAVKHCWRCGTDLDRRRRQQLGDYLAAVLVLWPYSCRRCGARRYRWGRRSGEMALL